MIIYLVTNLINNKLYIGQTVRALKKRWLCHQLKGDALFNAIQKYGAENFSIIELDNALTIEELNEKEIYWIKFLNTVAPYGYNIRLGGNGGGHLSEETRRKIGLVGKGRKHSEEWKTEMSKRNSGENNPMFGKSPHLGKKYSEEHRKNISEGQRGKVLSVESKARLKEANDQFFALEENRIKHRLTTLVTNQDRQRILARSKKMGGKPFMCVETGEIFELLQDAALKFNVDKRNIHSVLKGKAKTLRRKYTFKYV